MLPTVTTRPDHHSRVKVCYVCLVHPIHVLLMGSEWRIRGKSGTSLSEESPSPDKRVEAEKGDVSFSACSKSIQSSVSWSSVSSPSSESWGADGGGSDAGISVPSMAGESLEAEGSSGIWPGVWGDGMADVRASVVGKELRGHLKLVT